MDKDTSNVRMVIIASRKVRLITKQIVATLIRRHLNAEQSISMQDGDAKMGFALKKSVYVTINQIVLMGPMKR